MFRRRVLLKLFLLTLVSALTVFSTACAGEEKIVEVTVEVEKIVEVEKVVEKEVEKVVIATAVPGKASPGQVTLDPADLPDSKSSGGDVRVAVVGFGTLGTSGGSLPDVPFGGARQLGGAESLFAPGPQNFDEMQLASDWSLASDLSSVEITIRDGVKFHSGHDLTGHDVKATFDRGVFPDTFGEGLASVNRGVMQSATLKEITSTDSEVVFNFEDAPTMTHAMTGFTDFTFMLSRKADWEEHKGSFKKIDLKKVTGTGPFKFVETTADHFLVEANVDYWNPHTPYLDRVETIYFSPFTPALTAAGQTNMLDVFQATAPSDNEKIGAIPQISRNTVLWPFYWHILFNSDKPPFDDVRMRQAVALVVAPEILVDGMGQALGSTFGGGWFPHHWRRRS